MSQPGPCAMCGATNYALSLGGPSICPTCDCGIPPETTRARRRVTELEAENAALRKRLTAIECPHCKTIYDHLYPEKP